MFDVVNLIEYLEYKIQLEFSLTDLKIDTLHFIDQCYCDLSDQRLINYRDARSIRTLYSYNIFGKSGLYYIPGGNEIYDDELAFRIINDDIDVAELKLLQLKTLKEEIIRYYAIENGNYRVQKVEGKIENKSIVDYFFNDDGSSYALTSTRTMHICCKWNCESYYKF